MGTLMRRSLALIREFVLPVAYCVLTVGMAITPNFSFGDEANWDATALIGTTGLLGSGSGLALSGAVRANYLILDHLAVGGYFYTVGSTSTDSSDITSEVRGYNSQQYNLGVEGFYRFSGLLRGLEFGLEIGLAYYSQTFVAGGVDFGPPFGNFKNISQTRAEVGWVAAYYYPVTGPISLGLETSVLLQAGGVFALGGLCGFRVSF